MKPLCIYHGNCADGFGSAWVVWKHFAGEVDFYPGVYQRPPPDVTDRHVIMVDFSYKREVMLEMAETARTVLVLDHHKTAKEDLRPDGGLGILAVEPERTIEQWRTFCEDWDRDQRGVFVLFDMERSGAGITWDFFNPGEQRPKLIDHIEDRDLWRFKLPKTREIQASMFSLPYDFHTWDERFTHFEYNAETRQRVIAEGEAIERKHFKDINELLEVVTRPMKFQIPIRPDTGMRTHEIVPVANLPYTMASDAGHALCERNYFGMTLDSEAERVKNGGDLRETGPYKHPFAACYWDKPDGRQFSLRSQADGYDVSGIASLYGGGGHARASGFLVPYDRLSELEP